MDSEVSQYLRRIGRRGGKISRRQLSPDDAKRMVRVREARRAYRQFHTQCFWSFDPEYIIVESDIPWVVEHLRAHGARAGWEKAERLCR